MPAGLTKDDMMFSVRETPWHGMGAVLSSAPKNIDDALEKSGLGWEVVQRPIHFAANDGELVRFERDGAGGTRVPAGFVNVRSDTGEALGTVSDRYKVLQNRDAFSWLSNLIGSELHFETAGSLAGGRRVWVMARRPDYIEIGGDTTGLFVFITNSHDGYRAVKAAVSPVRIVCQNTLTAALGAAPRTYSIAHLGDPQQKLVEARNVLDITINYGEQFKQLGDRLASSKLAEAKLKKVLEKLYPTDGAMSDRKVANRTDAKNHIMWLFKEGPTVGNSPGSAWSAYNAITEYVDYGESTDHDGKLTRAMDDPTTIKAKSLPLVAAAAGVSMS